MARAKPSTVRTTCPYCGVGCGVVASVAADGRVEVGGDPDHPANFGRLCSKGSALAETLGHEGRLMHPEIGGGRASWDEALGLVADTFARTIAEHGPDSVAFYVSGQLLTEDYYVANKLMKGFIGSANIDTNSRLCMASSVAGHRRAFGADTVPGTYRDLELADLVVLVGSNLAWCHPVIFQRIAAAREARPQMKVVLIDPRHTATAELADLHLAIRSDGDTALFMGLLAHLEEARAIDRDYVDRHTRGIDAALAAARSLSMGDVARATGLGEADIAQFYGLFAASDKAVTVYSQGVNQSAAGTDKVNAIINVHLATGRIGRPGVGPFSVTGQPNAMGGREVGGLANQLVCHMELENAGHRAVVQSFWNAPTIADRPGLKAVDMFKAVRSGRIKAIWIMATNPADSIPRGHEIDAALADCPFVVVSDVTADTDTARHADVLLPAAAWGEKDGTVTNSERRISRQRAFLAAPRDAKPDWWIVCEVARRMGYGEAFDYPGPAAIFREFARLSAEVNDGQRDFDIGALAGLSDGGYARIAPVQWPVRAGSIPSADKRFFADGGFFTDDGRARFVAVSPPARAEISEHHPLILNTGRVRDHWHTMTRTAKSPRLSAHMAEPFAEIHPADAARAGIANAELVEVESAHGAVVVRALVSDRQQRGSVFVPMHWTGQTAARARIDTVVDDRTDPHSGQPALKATPVKVRRFEAGWYGFAVSARRPDPGACEYWALARARGGWRAELAGATPPQDWEDFARDLFGLRGQEECLAYHDSASRQYRLAAFEDGRLAAALFMSPEPVAVSRTWMAGRLEEGGIAAGGRFGLLAGRAGADQPDKGALVCSCFEVGLNEIVDAIASRRCASVADIGHALRAGTNCGSCRSEIQGLIDVAGLKAAE